MGHAMSQVLPKTAIFSADEISQILGTELSKRFSIPNGKYTTELSASITGSKLDWIKITMDAAEDKK